MKVSSSLGLVSVPRHQHSSVATAIRSVVFDADADARRVVDTERDRVAQAPLSIRAQALGSPRPSGSFVLLFVVLRNGGEWIDWAARSRLEPFAKAARTISKYMEGILGYVATRLSNGRVEGNNGKIRTITRRWHGFANPSSVIALIQLCFSNIKLEPPPRYPDPTMVAT